MNPNIRINSAIGLAELGCHTLRTLLIGLHDNNPHVRQTVEKEIIEKLNIEDILNYFSNNASYALSLKIALRDILEKDIPLNSTTKELFSVLIDCLEKENNNEERKE
jgi:hypothetical protein